MNKFKFYILILFTSVFFFSCNKDDDNQVEITPPVAYSVQYPIDLSIIEDYLRYHYLDMDLTNPNFADNDVVIKKIDNGQASLLSYENAATYPKLLTRKTTFQDVEYTLYYLVLRAGTGKSPINVDGVLSAYRGTYLARSTAVGALTTDVTATFFEESKFPQTFFNLNEVIIGWSELFPLFKTGKSTINGDGTVKQEDFGSGVFFIPSGLAYYNAGSGSIPSYSPLVFSIKLYDVKRLDQDNDGVPSYQEDLNGDGYIYDYRNVFLFPTKPVVEKPDGTKVLYADDTDKDGIPDFIDVDDDNDNYTTRLEITKPAGTNSGLSAYFPYDPIADDPATTTIETETKGIPFYNKGDKDIKPFFDYTTAGRKRVHVDDTYPIKP